MSQMITDGYLTPLEYASNMVVSARIKFYDTELGGTADDGRFLFEVTGLVTGGSFTFSDNSDMLANGSLSIIVDEVWQPNLSPSYLSQWYRCKCKVFKIYNYENGNKLEIPYGVYIVDSNSWNYEMSNHTLSMTLKDCMEALTENYGNTIIGRSGGHSAPDWAFVQYESILVEAGRDIGNTVTEFCENYAPFAFDVSIDGIVGENTFPYDLQIDSSSGLYEALSKMKEIIPAGRMYFDLNGMLHFGQIPMRWAEPCHALGKHLTSLIISEQRSVNPSSYRNAVIVWGAEVTKTKEAELTDKALSTPTDTSEVGKYFGAASDYSDGIFEDTKCEVLEFNGLCSNKDCREMARYELYKRRRMTETVTVTIVDRPLPMMYQFKAHVLNVGQKIEYTSVNTGETNLYILDEFSNDLASCTITLTMSRFYEFYPNEDEQVKGFGELDYTYEIDSNTGLMHIDFTGEVNTALFKVFVDNVFHSETCGSSIDVQLNIGQHYIQLFAYNPMIKQEEIGSFSATIGEVDEEWLTAENGNPLITQQRDYIILENEVK